MLPTKFRFIWPSDFRGEDLKKLANQKQELPMVAMFANGSVQNEQSLERTFHRCFLPSFTSFGWGVSEDKIKMWKVNGRQTPSDGKSSYYLTFGKVSLKGRKNYMKYENKLLLIQLLNVKISRKSDKENKWFYMKYLYIGKYFWPMITILLKFTLFISFIKYLIKKYTILYIVWV